LFDALRQDCNSALLHAVQPDGSVVAVTLSPKRGPPGLPFVLVVEPFVQLFNHTGLPLQVCQPPGLHQAVDDACVAAAEVVPVDDGALHWVWRRGCHLTDPAKPHLRLALQAGPSLTLALTQAIATQAIVTLALSPTRTQAIATLTLALALTLQAGASGWSRPLDITTGLHGEDHHVMLPDVSSPPDLQTANARILHITKRPVQGSNALELLVQLARPAEVIYP